MQLLDPTSYVHLQHLLDDAPHDLAMMAIAARHAAGLVFADDPGHPRLALVSPHWGRLYLLGKAWPAAAPEIRRLLAEVIGPAARADGAAVFSLAYPLSWESYLPEVFRDQRAVQAERQYYRWVGDQLPPATLPVGFSLLPADAKLLASGRIENLPALREEMASERASVEDFLARSFGIVAVHGDQLAGWCLSEYNTEARCEVGIATLDPFQRRGLATAMGRAFIGMARERGIREVGWHCWKENVASATTARKIGLEHAANYPVCVGWYNEPGARQ